MPATYPHHQSAKKGYQKNGTILAQSRPQRIYETNFLRESFEAKIGETGEAGEAGETGKMQ